MNIFDYYFLLKLNNFDCDINYFGECVLLIIENKIVCVSRIACL